MPLDLKDCHVCEADDAYNAGRLRREADLREREGFAAETPRE